ncbi:MAG: hypothetical protein K6G47_13660 [Clostridia bacterium]|nr:hypothetical protein [Clostridia bacterium]
MKSKFMRRGSCLILAGLLAVSMTACGKPSAKKLSDAAEKKVEAEEIALEDLKDTDNSKKNQKALKNGLLVNTTGEEFVDVFEDELEGFKIEDFGEPYDIDLEDFEAEDFKNISVYAKGDNLTGSENMKDVDLELVCVVEFEDSKKSDELFEDLMDKFEDLADDADIDLEDLSKDEYMNKGNKGHLIINIEAAAVFDVMFELQEGQGDMFNDDVKEAYKDTVGDLRIVIGFYYEGGVMTTIIGLSGDDMEDISTLAKAIGVKDPLTIESNDEMANAFVALYAPSYYAYLAKAQEAAQLIREHNEEVEAVKEEIDSSLEG